MKTVEKANQFILEEKETINPLFKPKAHFTPEIGWINDPNGFVFFPVESTICSINSTLTRVFGGQCTGVMLKVRTSSLGTTSCCPCSRQGLRYDGCFSGSAIVKDDVWLMYTGHIVK